MNVLMLIVSIIVPYIVIRYFYQISSKEMSINQFVGIVIIGGIASAFIATQVSDLFVVSGRTYNWYLLNISLVLCEELIKTIVTACIIRIKKYKSVLNGISVGAAVGAGFSLIESVVYADKAHWLYGNIDKVLDVITKRNIIFPGNHVIWTAINGAMIIICAYQHKLRYSYLFVLCVIVHLICNIYTPIWAYIVLGIAMWIMLDSIIDEETEKYKIG